MFVERRCKADTANSREKTDAWARVKRAHFFTTATTTVATAAAAAAAEEDHRQSRRQCILHPQCRWDADRTDDDDDRTRSAAPRSARAAREMIGPAAKAPILRVALNVPQRGN